MKIRRIFWKLFVGLLKFIWKVSLLILWGGLRLIEVILQQFNKVLKGIINA